MIVQISGEKCSRSACQATVDLRHRATHRDTGLPYCIRCARLINRACGLDVVLFPDGSAPT